MIKMVENPENIHPEIVVIIVINKEEDLLALTTIRKRAAIVQKIQVKIDLIIRDKEEIILKIVII